MFSFLVRFGAKAMAAVAVDSCLRASGLYRTAAHKVSRLVCDYTSHVWEENTYCESINAAGQKVQIQHCQRCPATKESRIRE